jgi:exosortase A-associated hydrolase 2
MTGRHVHATPPVDLSVEPFHFGPEQTPLFGCYHPPRGSATRDSGVVLCYPMAHELIRVHRAFRQLAARLARAGFPVLRFDYYGTGDSAGESDEARLDRWAEDVMAASRELRRRTGVSRLSLVGLRLGASLALRVAAADPAVCRLVLWQPVLEGRAMLAEFAQLHAAHVESVERASGATAGTRSRGAGEMEVLGITYSSAMRRDVEELDVRTVEIAPVREVLIVDNSEAGREFAAFADHLRASGARVAARHCPDKQIWLAEPYRLVMPHETIKVISEWS